MRFAVMRFAVSLVVLGIFLIGLANLHGQQQSKADQRSGSGSSIQPLINDSSVRSGMRFTEIFRSTFDSPGVLNHSAGKWRRETMAGSNNSGQHRQAPGRRHAAWYDRHQDKTAFIRDGVLVQRGFVADKSVSGFVSRDAGDQPRNFSYEDPDVRDAGEINFADFELHSSWLDTFAVKAVDGKQVPVLIDDELVEKKQYWGQPGKTDTASPNVTFSPGTFFEIEVSFAAMRALSHRHSFWLMPASANREAYDNDPANGLEIDIYEHELAADRDSTDPKDVSINEILLMKSIGGSTFPSSTRNELRDDGETAVRVKGINVGWHKIGLLWTKDKLVWFVDGEPMVQDSILVPQVKMFLILSREANTGASKSADPADHLLRANGDRIPSDSGLWGRNVASPANLDLIRTGKDEVLTRAVRVWKIESR